MKLSDIMRDLADLIDQKMNTSQGADLSTNSTQKKMDTVELPEPELDTNPIMVPPLQAKLEILKKSEGIPSAFDSEGPEDRPDELAMIKKNAGISAAQQEASEDNDITG
jgi:hypothetical protein